MFAHHEQAHSEACMALFRLSRAHYRQEEEEQVLMISELNNRKRRRSSFLDAAKTLESLFFSTANDTSVRLSRFGGSGSGIGDREPVVLPPIKTLASKPANSINPPTVQDRKEVAELKPPALTKLEIDPVSSPSYTSSESASDSDDGDEHSQRAGDALSTGAVNDEEQEEGEHTVSTTNTCLDCNETFKTPSLLRRHQKSRHQIQVYKCRTCSKLFNSIADRQTHKNNKHFSTIKIALKNPEFDADTARWPLGTEISSTRNKLGYFECPVDYCSFVTRIPGYWYEHVNTVAHIGTDPQKRKRRKVDSKWAQCWVLKGRKKKKSLY